MLKCIVCIFKSNKMFFITVADVINVSTNPCLPSPCGPFSQCRDLNGSPSCSCLPQYFGSPPNCRPECTINSDCTSDKACINERCIDPCPGSCGLNAECRVQTHLSICTCITGYKGDPFTSCSIVPDIGNFVLFLPRSVIYNANKIKYYSIILHYTREHKSNAFIFRTTCHRSLQSIAMWIKCKL